MTYEEVVKALECCSRPAECINCPLYDSYGLNCIGILRQATFDLLHSQNAEIEALKLINSTYVANTNEIREIAIKEFAERLQDRFFNYYDVLNENTSKSNYRGETLMVYEVADMIENCIDNLVKEMVGDRE